MKPIPAVLDIFGFFLVFLSCIPFPRYFIQSTGPIFLCGRADHLVSTLSFETFYALAGDSVRLQTPFRRIMRKAGRSGVLICFFYLLLSQTVQHFFSTLGGYSRTGRRLQYSIGGCFSSWSFTI
jgi:hypothetical protein